MARRKKSFNDIKAQVWRLVNQAVGFSPENLNNRAYLDERYLKYKDDTTRNRVTRIIKAGNRYMNNIASRNANADNPNTALRVTDEARNKQYSRSSYASANG